MATDDDSGSKAELRKSSVEGQSRIHPFSNGDPSLIRPESASSLAAPLSTFQTRNVRSIELQTMRLQSCEDEIWFKSTGSQ